MTYACLLLPFPPSVNNLFANNPRTRGRFPSKAYTAWQDEARHALLEQAPLPAIKGPYNATYTFGRPDKRRRDLGNLLKAPEDALVAHGIIEDDTLAQQIILQWADDVSGCRVEVEAA